MRKSFKNTLIFLLLWSAASVGYQFRGNRAIKPYVKSNLDNLIELQDQFLGIRHISKPRIDYVIFDTHYEPRDDSIKLGTGTLVTPQNNLENTLAKLFTFGLAKDINTTLSHELGHWNTYGLAERLGVKLPDKLPMGLTNHFEDDVGLKLIIEGIGVYFGEKEGISDVGRYLPNIEWPRHQGDYSATRIYKFGYRLVKPIIDKFGKNGVEHLLLNPPKREELTKLQEYQKRIMAALSR